MKCTELVIRDHMDIRRGLGILDGMLRVLEMGERIEVADVRALFNFLQHFGEDYHQSVEEKVLFPALVRATPQGSPIHQLVMGHGEERALVGWIKDAFGSRRVRDFLYSSRRLGTLLREHLDREDAILNDLADRLLSREEDEEVVAEFRKNRREPETYVNFSRLERIYTLKPLGSAAILPAESVRARGAVSNL